MVQVTFYAIRPGNRFGLFYNGPGTHTGLVLYEEATVSPDTKSWCFCCLTVHVTAGIHLYLTGATACNSKLTCSRTLHTLYFNPSLQISCTVYSEQNR